MLDAFSEKDKEVQFDIVIDGLKVSRKLAKYFTKYPSNATILDTVFEEQSMNFAITYHPSSKTYRFQVKRLPTPIHPERTKIQVDKIIYFKLLLLIMLFISKV
jgi:hypothetical protein